MQFIILVSNVTTMRKTQNDKLQLVDLVLEARKKNTYLQSEGFTWYFVPQAPQAPQAFCQVLCDFEALGRGAQMSGGVGRGR
jgi:hypothetical protein